MNTEYFNMNVGLMESKMMARSTTVKQNITIF